ncbi:hypothetical protein Cni_G17698 [Canna indica]|uniref:Non-specific lipid-transfer protein n=1 Tax=Canna indica TaxID=4628 RepID=A0AAQ3KJP5_9LILI|nr:hypothetical protein Cni_G17698 [Canna indica]
MKKAVASCFLFLLLAAHLIPEPALSITCAEVAVFLSPCLPFLLGVMPMPTLMCCGGVRVVGNLALTVSDRRTACNCMKLGTMLIQNLRAENISSLPAACAAPLLPFPNLASDCN